MNKIKGLEGVDREAFPQARPDQPMEALLDLWRVLTAYKGGMPKPLYEQYTRTTDMLVKCNPDIKMEIAKIRRSRVVPKVKDKDYETSR